MSLTLPDHWIWDFWFAGDGDDVHVFFLHAPRVVGHPELRHRHARIGHAVSRDLRTWEILPTALRPGPPGAFDDLATWTGSTLNLDGRWHMLYTGVSSREGGAVQRIGLATSDDLMYWEKHGVLIEADPRWYETAGAGRPEEAWRDPWVFWDDDTRRFHVLVTARATSGPVDGRGVIGHASSPDLRTWQVGPPLSEPGEFHHLEVPQLVHLGGAWRILFCVSQQDHSAARLARPGVVAEGGIHYLVSDRKFGPYTLDRDTFLIGLMSQAGTTPDGSSTTTGAGSSSPGGTTAAMAASSASSATRCHSPPTPTGRSRFSSQTTLRPHAAKREGGQKAGGLLRSADGCQRVVVPHQVQVRRGRVGLQLLDRLAAGDHTGNGGVL